jgi:outer membrane murein-binding lipoprotein Lpp
VDDITAVVIILLEGNPKDRSWAAAQKLMNNVDKLMERLRGFKAVIDEGKVAKKTVEACRSYLELPHFNRDIIFNKSRAAAGLCEWAINIVKYYDVVSEVEPKRQELAAANAKLQEANTVLAAVQQKVGFRCTNSEGFPCMHVPPVRGCSHVAALLSARADELITCPKEGTSRLTLISCADTPPALAAAHTQVAELNAQVKVLEDQYNAAVEDKESAIQESERCQLKLKLANRLISALASEGGWHTRVTSAMHGRVGVHGGPSIMTSLPAGYDGPHSMAASPVLFSAAYDWR